MPDYTDDPAEISDLTGISVEEMQQQILNGADPSTELRPPRVKNASDPSEASLDIENNGLDIKCISDHFGECAVREEIPTQENTIAPQTPAVTDDFIIN